MRWLDPIPDSRCDVAGREKVLSEPSLLPNDPLVSMIPLPQGAARPTTSLEVIKPSISGKATLPNAKDRLQVEKMKAGTHTVPPCDERYTSMGPHARREGPAS